MLRTIDLRTQSIDERTLRYAIPRPQVDVDIAASQVKTLIDEVKQDGVSALYEHAERFDGVTKHQIAVSQDRIKQSLETCPREVREAFIELISRLRVASEMQVPQGKSVTLSDGATITQRWHPVSRVGLYAPGGKAAYPSSVIMNVIAAQTAGVASIALASPAQQHNDGLPHEAVLWAAALTGVTEVYAMGGASAIAAFAYGLPELSLEPVDVITGPGNVYVAAAKRLVNGIVGIDSEAGTTEILIIADDTANASFVAADLLSQAEHDEYAASVLVTTSEALAHHVRVELAEQVASTQHRERAETALSGQQSAIILVKSIEDAVQVSNAYAPEHLEILTRDNERTLQQIQHAGAIFVGEHSPVSLGDYLAGSNHVLPTGGTARFSSGLGAHTFLRSQQIIDYSSDALKEVTEHISALAKAEGLPAHADAARIRFTQAENHS